MSSSSTQTPGPTAKRRRVDTANATLRKPFRSPMIRRPSEPTPGQETPGPGATPGPEATPARPTSSAVFTTPTPSTPTPFTTKGPLTRRPLPTLTRPARPGGPDAETSPTKTTVPAEQQEEDPAVQEQALKIIRQTRPGQPVDAELKAATAKWRAAGRLAAEDLFELVKGRVEGMGMEERKGRGRGWDDDDDDFGRGGKAKGGGGEGERGEGGRYVEDRGGEDRGRYEEDRGGVGGGDGGSQERVKGSQEEGGSGDDEGFTMLAMLRSLNIEPELLGYDAKEGKWKD